MWWESSDCPMSNSAISSHWHTGASERLRTSTMRTRSGSDSALATVAMRSASSPWSRPTAGAQHAAAEGPGTVGREEVISAIVGSTACGTVAGSVGRIHLNDPQTLYRHWEEQQWSPFAVELGPDAEQWRSLSGDDRDLVHWALASLMVAEERIT